jgi:hypothetical protein
MSKLSRKLGKAIDGYITKFEKKHDCYLEYFINDDIIGIVVFGDNFFNVSDIIYDIDSKQPKDLIWDWYSDTLDRAMEGKRTINYQSYTKGLRYGMLTD